MATVKDVYAAVDQIAPFAAQMDFDNAGFLVGRGEQQVTRLLVSLDITEEVVWEAVERRINTMQPSPNAMGNRKISKNTAGKHSC